MLINQNTIEILTERLKEFDSNYIPEIKIDLNNKKHKALISVKYKDNLYYEELFKSLTKKYNSDEEIEFIKQCINLIKNNEGDIIFSFEYSDFSLSFSKIVEKIHNNIHSINENIKRKIINKMYPDNAKKSALKLASYCAIFNNFSQ